MTNHAIAGSLVDEEYSGFGSVTRPALLLLDGWNREHGDREVARGGEGIFAASDLSRLANVRELDCLQVGGASQNLTGVTAWQVMRWLANARQSMLTLQVARGFSCIVQIEPTLGNLPPNMARRMEVTVGLLRAIGFALQDDILPALCFAQSVIKQIDECSDNRAAATICRLAYWKLGDLDSFFALPSSRPRSAIGGRETICDVFDLAIEAAVEIDQLRLSSARHLAQDALDLAATTFIRHPALAALPASLLAQLFYEQGSLDEAEQMVLSHLPAIRAGGTIESALRTYHILARIASRRGQRDHAAVILKEAEDLAKQRGWCRLAAASIAERANLLLEDDRVVDAMACADCLGRLAESSDAGSSRSRPDIHRIWTLVRVRITLAQTPSRNAVATLRQLHHEAVSRRDLYEALHLAIYLVDALEVIGEESEALTVLIRALTLGSAVGVYQAFLDGGPRVGNLLTRVYDRARTSDDRSRELLPYIGSLLSRRRARETSSPSLPPKSTSGGVLSERERITLVWMSRGLSNKGIAKKLGITPETVKSHAKNIFMKLTVKTRAEAVSRASGLGLI